MFKIYTLSYCRYSSDAIILLQSNNLFNNDHYHECDNKRHETDSLVPHYKTYPKIFYINDKKEEIFIGGKTDLENILKISNDLISTKKLQDIEIEMEIKKIELKNIPRHYLLQIIYYIIHKK